MPPLEPTLPADSLPARPLTLKSGAERFHRGGQPLDATLLDFWRWSASDLVGNALRGVLAEYLVARALGLNPGVRVEWDAFDLLTPAGLKIEVKSAAYLQTWDQRRHSTIQFNIRPTQLLVPGPSEAATARRQADVYVFCLLSHTDKATVDPLNLNQWAFFVLPAAVLDARCGVQKTIGLAGLIRLEPIQTDFDGLASVVSALNP